MGENLNSEAHSRARLAAALELASSPLGSEGLTPRRPLTASAATGWGRLASRCRKHAPAWEAGSKEES